MGRVTLAEGDITAQEVDAIVNAANNDLVLGAGVAGAIRAGGGPSIQAECDAHGPIAVGEAVVTGAGELPARFVIHAAGMALGGQATEESLRSCLRESLRLAAEVGCATIAVPAIGAGIGGLGMQRCAEVSLEETRRFLESNDGVQEIRFVLFGEPAYRVFEAVNDAERVAAQMERLKRR